MPVGSPHSVWALVNHVQYWHRVVHRWAQGLPVDHEALGAAGGWPPVDDPPDEASWQAAVSRTTALNAELAGLVEDLTDEQLARTAGEGPASLWQVLQGLIAHNSYHTASIIDVRRLLGLWPPKA